MTHSRGFVRFTRSRRALALGLAVVLLGSAQTAAAEAAVGGWHGLGWDLPPLQQTQSVDGTDGGLRPGPAPSTASAGPATGARPAASSGDVDLPATSAAAMTPAKGAPGQPVIVSRGHGQR